MKKEIKRYSRDELLDKLLNIIDISKETIVISISSRGGFYAENIANKYSLNYEFLFIEKVKSPINKSTVIASISETKDIILIDEFIESFDISKDFVFNELERVYEEKILQDLYKFRGGESIISLENKNVLLVDEVASTGITILTAIKSAINQKAATINVAIPLIAKETAEYVSSIVDNTFFVSEIEEFVNIDYYLKENE